ncbi:hypothetical protein Fmac_010753 [Flemingia macrophylla]|uniref:Uncharacterized protein n=1 Tax=Flemingia macrophylla TaxID=520843 RepID=A0ABD1MKG9_9FABA
MGELLVMKQVPVPRGCLALKHVTEHFDETWWPRLFKLHSAILSICRLLQLAYNCYFTANV